MERTAESQKRVAIVDCGTNTFTMVIVDLVAVNWVEIFRLRCQVFLGKGGFASAAILPDRFAKGLDSLGILKEASQNYDVDEVRVFGTSALRDASNSSDFLAKAKAKVGWDIEIIDGDQEAELIQSGVQLTVSNLDVPLMIMDIGGGSLELIILAPGESGNWEKRWARSFDAGVSRLAEFGKPADPLTEAGVQRYSAYLNETLASMTEAIHLHQPECLVGSSGSFDTFMELVQQAQSVPDDSRDDSRDDLRDDSAAVSKVVVAHPPVQRIDRDGFASVHSQLIGLDFAARLALPGMAPARARLIPLSSMLVQHVLDLLPSNSKLYQSSYALREGALRSMIG
jgi:exopolyphosphatase/guanosine-5'-triphosphate,3'-diphosphate pyrophosphatase